MLLALDPQDLGSNSVMLIADVFSPKLAIDLGLETPANVEERQLGFATERVAGQDRGEDGGTIDQ